MKIDLLILVFHQTIPTISNENETSTCHLDTNSDSTDHSSLYRFATALNLCYQRNLFQLHKHCQSIVFYFFRKKSFLYSFNRTLPPKSSQSINEILPIQNFESYTENISNYFPVNNDSIQNLRRMMQREEKARLSL